jgi:HTH-type transcriptional regulator, sugar sensing transcriptional regulator
MENKTYFMDTKILEDIGLTKGEIKVYLALLEKGPTSAGAVLKKANIQNSVFHFCVNRLIKKGLVSYIKKGKVRIYKAAAPENLLTYLKDKEKEIGNILPELKAKQLSVKETHEVEIFDGTKGIITALNILIEDTKKWDEFLFFSADVDEKNEEIQKFYERFDAKRKAKGLISKGIAPLKLKALFEKRKYLQMKYSKNAVPSNTGICNDKMVLISWGENSKAVLIQSRQIVFKQKEFFRSFWNNLD